MLKVLKLAEGLIFDICREMDSDSKEHDLVFSARLAFSVAVELLQEKEKEVTHGE